MKQVRCRKCSCQTAKLRGAKHNGQNKQKDATDQLQSHLKGSTNKSHQTAANSNWDTHPNKKIL